MKDLRKYEEFVDVISSFKKHYKLAHSIREIDWFLWLYGKEYLAPENNKKLKTPSNELLDEYIKKVTTIPRYVVGDRALSKLKNSCPSNSNLENVWLKVIVINNLYFAGVIDTFKMAQHIHRNSDIVDKKLLEGDLGLVDKIRSGHGIISTRNGMEINFYAFATKYCSEHRPDVYPIFDSKVRGMLYEYKGRGGDDNFAEFTG